MPKNTTQCPRPGLEPGLLDLESGAQTTAPTTQHLAYTDSITSPSSLRCFSALVLALFSESKSSLSSSIWFSISRLSFSSSLLLEDSSSTLRGKYEEQNKRSVYYRQAVFLWKFSRDFEARRFSLKGYGTRRRLFSSRLLPYSAISPFCVRNG